MKVYSVCFEGYYPVGACAVVVAEGLEHAKILLEEKLKARKLEQSVPLTAFTEIDVSIADVLIVLDGNY